MPKKATRQQYIPGTEPPSIPEIDSAADDLASTRSARMEMLEEEVKAADKLLGLMKKHDLTTYEYDGKVVSLSQLEKVKVRRKSEEKIKGQLQ